MSNPDLSAFDQLARNFFKGHTQMPDDESAALNQLTRHFEHIPIPTPPDQPPFPSLSQALVTLASLSHSTPLQPAVVASITIIYNIIVPLAQTKVRGNLFSRHIPSLALGIQALHAVDLVTITGSDGIAIQATILDPEGD